MKDHVEDIAAKHERIVKRVNQVPSPFGLMITVDRTARVTETTGISSELPAIKSIQSQAATVPPCAHCFAELAAVACGSPK
jgi:hypothetical protein